MRRVGVVVLAVGAVAMTACGGPKAPFDVGTQAAPVDLVLGERAAVEEAPVGPLNVGIPDDLAPFFPLTTPTTQPGPTEPCPDFDPLEPVAPAQTAFLDGAPQNGTYTYRASTSETVGQTKQQYSGPSTWKVTRGTYNPQTGGFPITIDVTVGKVTSRRVLAVFQEPVKNVPLLDKPDTTDLNVYTIDQYNGTVILLGLPPLPRNLPAIGTYGPPGVYLVSQTMGDKTFTPLLPMPLFNSPVYQKGFTALGTDGKSVLQYDSKVIGTEYVNACGKKVESTRVELTNGKFATQNDKGETVQVKFDEAFNFGIQFGGLPVRDSGKVSTTSGNVGAAKTTVMRTFDYTANTEPKPTKR